MNDGDYHADPSLKGKLRRRWVRLRHRRPALRTPERPMVSISFDDAPCSAFHAGAQVLEARGVRGTYFVCTGQVGADTAVGRLGGREDMLRVQGAGHEVACHTATHLDCGRADAQAAAADLERSRGDLADWGLAAPETFAYPYGDVGPAAKSVLAGRFALCRAIHPGVVTRGCDLAQAPAVGIEGEGGEARARRWIERAAGRPAWLILYTHEVGEVVTTYGCTRSALERLVDHALALGAEVVTVAQGARRLGAAA